MSFIAFQASGLCRQILRCRQKVASSSVGRSLLHNTKHNLGMIRAFVSAFCHSLICFV